jgi:hypothetical protein
MHVRVVPIKPWRLIVRNAKAIFECCISGLNQGLQHIVLVTNRGESSSHGNEDSSRPRSSLHRRNSQARRRDVYASASTTPSPHPSPSARSSDEESPGRPASPATSAIRDSPHRYSSKACCRARQAHCEPSVRLPAPRSGCANLPVPQQHFRSQIADKSIGLLVGPGLVGPGEERTKAQGRKQESAPIETLTFKCCGRLRGNAALTVFTRQINSV